MSYTKYQQGIYKPVHPEKYKGTLPICYRSSLEMKFARFCDHNTNILEWGSESIAIPYIKPTDNKVHRYFVDFNLVMRDANGNKVKYLVEIKPYKQTHAPKENKNKKESTILHEKIQYTINASKWHEAKKYAESKGWKFIIITEKDLN